MQWKAGACLRCGRGGAASRAAAAGLAVLVLAGCATLAPPHETPPLPVPASYPAGDRAEGALEAGRLDLAWRSYFTDPLLQQLIETALANNRDLRTAALRVDEARAAFRIQRSDRFPGIAVGAQGARSRVPGDLNTTGDALVGGEYRAEFGLSSWELDLWGRVRSLEASALEGWLATDAARQAVHVALIGQVADGYLGLRELDERVEIARKSVAAREASYRIFQRRYEVGSTSRLEVTQVQTLLTQAQMLHAQLAQQREQQINALRVLVGGDPGPLAQKAPFDETTVLVQLSPGLPSGLLTQRPDIIAAEHRLRASNANIGAARAAFLPRIALTASYGTASAELDGLFESGSRAWSFVPTISLPIFDGGRRRANLALSEVRRDIAVAEYEQTIQAAFREVADALAAHRWVSAQVEVARVARDAQAERARLAQLRYDNGSSAYLEVLDAQRDLLDAEQQLVGTRRALLSSQVALYSALGGGAEPAEPVAAIRPEPGPATADARLIP
ncbi:NodT family RND efflux system outer membrane lipoprotein [Thauera linaloolentis 47Lol = DSM 12138]|uniref:NodT family RND efflux system outer membrane lipoprotein n=2 Tax=Thauera linaloolentis TaxID=76112 RepID=N6Y5A4_THAL4|nr:NodT family RND efflux system outer membrane lipoprotein [Thauera linaloolentis 47Lol = DSM 12138]